MELIVLNSNSAGNGYVLKGKTQSLLIECGVHFQEVLKALDFKTEVIQGCLVTHEHLDHFKYVDMAAKYGINVYASKGTLINKQGHRFYSIEPNRSFKLGEFTIFPFDVEHDCREPFGYIIGHPESGNIMFITDSAYTKYKFSGISQIIVEANHSKEYLKERVLNGKMQHFVYNRLINSHMSIETCQELLLGSDLTNVVNIILIHLSNANANEKEFKSIIESKTGKKVHIANKNTIINLDLIPF